MMKRYLLTGTIFVMMMFLLAGCGGGDKQDKTQPIAQQAKNGNYAATLQITPGIVGPNTFTAAITDDKQQPVSSGQATLHFSMAGMEHGKSELPLKKGPDGKWSADGPHLMMAGTWALQLIWTDEAGKKVTFDYTVKLEE